MAWFCGKLKKKTTKKKQLELIRIARAYFLTHHFPAILNALLMRNPMQK